MKDLCKTNDEHIYKRYYCKKCKVFHKKGSKIADSHKKHKLNRYFCPECNITHISSRGKKFLKHLDKRGKEISYYGMCCAIKCDYKKVRKINLSDEQAFTLIENQQKRSNLWVKIERIVSEKNYSKYSIEQLIVKFPKIKPLYEEIEQSKEEYKYLELIISIKNERIHPHG